MTHPDTAFRVIPLAETADRLRRLAATDVPGRPLPRRDSHRHQCRSCLSLTRPNEEYLLASYSPFAQPQPYAETGPIFIHKDPCAPYAKADEFPADFRDLDLVVRAYSEIGEILDAQRVGDRPVETAIAALFRNPGAAWLHVRNTGYGCFICRIERALNRGFSHSKRNGP